MATAIAILRHALTYRAKPQQHALVEDVATVMNESMSPQGAAAPCSARVALDATERVTH
jgi:hypothetical protein